MSKDDILKKWDDLSQIYKAKENQLELMINDWLMTNDWLQGHIEMSAEEFEQEASKLSKELDELEIRMNQLIAEHTKMCVEEARKEQELKTSKAAVMTEFGTNPDEIKVVGGVLSSNPDQSHLMGISKTPEQLEQERESLLATIKDQVMKKAITLGEASKWKHYINTAYGNSAQEQEKSIDMKR